jgi:hypothetical protein
MIGGRAQARPFRVRGRAQIIFAFSMYICADAALAYSRRPNQGRGTLAKDEPMLLKAWMCNTNKHEDDHTVDVLNTYGASDVKVDVATKDNKQDGTEYNFDLYVDTEEDVANAVAVMLFYNDRSASTIKAAMPQIQALIASLPKGKGA